jgi:Transposase DDE domain
MSQVKSRVRQSSRSQVARVPAPLAGSCAAMLHDHCTRLRDIGDHPNRVLHYDELLVAHLLGFYDGVVRSLRTLDARTVSGETIRESLDDLRLARSTISDAMGQLPAAALLPLLKELLARLPANCSNPELADLVTLKKRLCALDGSYFRIPADVLWAMMHIRPNGQSARQIRLDLHLDVLRFVPTHARVDGQDQSSEPQAFIGTLESGVIYLADRNFVDYGFLRAVIDLGSDFVVRIKKNSVVAVQADAVLTPGDIEAGVLRDQRVTLPGSRWTRGVDTPLREVVVFDPVRRQEVRLLTTLLDVPAQTIGKLYRHRWAIELFFRWLKCVAKIKHLFSQSSNGITLQFYVVIIATLLMYLRTGSKPSVYCLVLLSSAASGDLCLEKVPEVLERIARERELERLRRAKKKPE